MDVARATLPYGRSLKKGDKALVELRVRLTPTRFPTSIRYTPVDNISLYFTPGV